MLHYWPLVLDGGAAIALLAYYFRTALHREDTK